MLGQGDQPVHRARHRLRAPELVLRPRGLRPAHGHLQRPQRGLGQPVLQRRERADGQRDLHRRHLPGGAGGHRVRVPDVARHRQVRRPGQPRDGPLQRRRPGGRGRLQEHLRQRRAVPRLRLRLPAVQHLRHCADKGAERRPPVGFPARHGPARGGHRAGLAADARAEGDGLPEEGRQGGHAGGLCEVRGQPRGLVRLRPGLRGVDHLRPAVRHVALSHVPAEAHVPEPLRGRHRGQGDGLAGAHTASEPSEPPAVEEGCATGSEGGREGRQGGEGRPAAAGGVGARGLGTPAAAGGLAGPAGAHRRGLRRAGAAERGAPEVWRRGGGIDAQRGPHGHARAHV
mmetsp:Transcript_93331/g.259430  ORF Transcript_93331/g.259430 Transcript_93331/m.259430 type:complete len:343 (+) Transcript_93331:181-1209(+)